MNTSTMVRSKATRGRAVRQLAVVYAVMVALLGAAGSPLFAQAPTLGELAKKEQDRRKTVKAGEVFSNKICPRLPRQSTPPPGYRLQPGPLRCPEPRRSKSRGKGGPFGERACAAREAQRSGRRSPSPRAHNALSTDAATGRTFQRPRRRRTAEAVAELGDDRG